MPPAASARCPGKATSTASSGRRAQAWAYALATLWVVVVTLIRFPIEPLFRGRAAYALYYLPILWAAWYGGIGPTLLAVALSLAASWAFVIPGAQPGYRATVALFLVVCAGIALIARAARGTQQAKLYLVSIVESSHDAIVTKMGGRQRPRDRADRARQLRRSHSSSARGLSGPHRKTGLAWRARRDHREPCGASRAASLNSNLGYRWRL